ncbi:MAG: energy-coupling factor ABC transporter substrate-binding protein [Methanomicrobiales archaeon]|nr:energy-coupling factor ABC transporter substrate-binding protein [Methanomicrobiales archaeon]
MKYGLELVVAAAIIIFAAIFLVQNAAIQANLGEGEEAWGGADGNAAEIIEASGYEPWFSPLWEPPSGEIESLFFSLQAAIGALVIGYFFGYYRGKNEHAS